MEALQTEYAQPDEARSGIGLRLGEHRISFSELAGTRTPNVVAGPLSEHRREL